MRVEAKPRQPVEPHAMILQGEREMRRSYMPDRFRYGHETYGDNDTSVQSQPWVEPG